MRRVENIVHDLSTIDKVQLLSWSELLGALDDGLFKYSQNEINSIVEVLKTKTIADVVGRSPRQHGLGSKLKSFLRTCTSFAK